MDFSVSSLSTLARFTVQDPRAAARSLMAMNLPNSARWLMFGLVASGSALLTHVGLNLFPPTDASLMGNAFASPLETALLQAGLLLITVFCIFAVGKWRGGTGNFADALLLISWLQLVLLVLQAAQILAMMIFPPLAEVMAVLGLGLSFWLLSQFIAQLHGFVSGWRVFLSIVAAILVVALVISMVLVAFVGVGV